MVDILRKSKGIDASRGKEVMTARESESKKVRAIPNRPPLFVTVLTLSSLLPKLETLRLLLPDFCSDFPAGLAAD